MAASIRVPESSTATSLESIYEKRLMIFGGRANPALAAAIGHQLGVGLCPIELKTFSSGEVYCRIEDSIRGADVFLIQSVCANQATGVGANDALVELLLMVDAAVG